MKKERTFVYTLCRGIAAVLYTLFFGAKARGVERFPQDENCIILANHIHALDPVTVARFYKVSEIHFMAKDSLFRNPFLHWLITKLHAFPVNRGATDMGAMRKAMQVVRDGHVLGIFPEGHRQTSEHVESIETGVAVIALKTNVPLVPVLITGRYSFRGRLRVVVGDPIPMDDLRESASSASAPEELKRRIIDALEALRPLSDF